MSILAFVVAVVVIHGINAGVDENSIYKMDRIHEYEKSINDMKIAVEKLKIDVDNESCQPVVLEKPDYFNEIINMNAKIEELRFCNGFTDVRGPGIMLRVADSKSEDVTVDIMDKIVHDVDITVLLNDLKRAGAEAIDVNGKRIINISEVVCAGPLLQINGEGVPAPFIIRAIGNPEELYKVVNDKGTYAYDLKNKYNMEVATMMSYNIVVPKFYGNYYKIIYAKNAE